MNQSMDRFANHIFLSFIYSSAISVVSPTSMAGRLLVYGSASFVSNRSFSPLCSAVEWYCLVG